MAEKVVLRTALGKHAHVQPLRDGRVQSDRIAFEFLDYEPLPKAFRLMVRGDDLDLSEMAVVTHLLAHHYRKPLIGLPVPLWSRLPHTNLICPADSDISNPRDLEGRKVGVRAYAQTSGVWVRGILQSVYGVHNDRILWGTVEDAHLAEYTDPAAITRRYPSQPPLRQLMMEGEFAAIMGERNVDPAGVRSVIPDAEAAALRWIAETGIYPINHALTIRRAVLNAHPWLAPELMKLFSAARDIAVAEGAPPPPEYGFAAMRGAIQLLLDFSADQKITPHRYAAEELFLPL